MDLLVTSSNAVDILIATGRIDTTTAPTFAAKVNELTGGVGRTLLIDFADVRYISSIGFRTLLIAAQTLERSSGRLALCALNPSCYRLFDLGGFTTMFSIYEARDAALAALTARAT